MYRVMGIQETGEEYCFVSGSLKFCEEWMDMHENEFPEFRSIRIVPDLNLLAYF